MDATGTGQALGPSQQSLTGSYGPEGEGSRSSQNDFFEIDMMGRDNLLNFKIRFFIL